MAMVEQGPTKKAPSLPEQLSRYISCTTETAFAVPSPEDFESLAKLNDFGALFPEHQTVASEFVNYRVGRSETVKKWHIFILNEMFQKVKADLIRNGWRRDGTEEPEPEQLELPLLPDHKIERLHYREQVYASEGDFGGEHITPGALMYMMQGAKLVIDVLEQLDPEISRMLQNELDDQGIGTSIPEDHEGQRYQHTWNGGK